MKLLFPILAAMALAGCGRGEDEAPRVTVEGAVVTVPAVPGGMGAAYFTLNTNRDGSRLVSVTSPMIRMIELHESRGEGGLTQMLPLSPEGATFGPSQSLRFAPGGKHAMLMGMDPAVQVGGKVALTFEVERVGTVTADADVRGPGQAHANP